MIGQTDTVVNTGNLAVSFQHPSGRIQAERPEPTCTHHQPASVDSQERIVHVHAASAAEQDDRGDDLLRLPRAFWGQARSEGYRTCRSAVLGARDDLRIVHRRAALVGASGMSYVYEPDVVPVISLGKIPGQTVLTRIFMLQVSGARAPRWRGMRDDEGRMGERGWGLTDGVAQRASYRDARLVVSYSRDMKRTAGSLPA